MNCLVLICCLLLAPSGVYCWRSSRQAAGDDQSPVYYITIGDNTATIQCGLSSQAVNVAWYYENTPLDPQAQGQTPAILADGRLRFPNPQIAQSGWYTCATTSGAEREERDCLVIVGGKPTFALQPRDIAVVVGTNLELPCVARGTPPPDVTWFYDGDVIIDGMGNYRINATTHSLIIQNVQPQDVLKQMNPKPFYCEAENVFGSVESGRARVSLDEMNTPYASQLNETIYVPESSPSTELQCIVGISGKNFNFMWKKDHSSLLVTTKSLTVASDESGYYCCEATKNNVSNMYCATVVFRKSGVATHLPRTTVSVQSGRSVNLLCSAQTENFFDLPVFKWYTGGSMPQQVVNTSRVTVLQDKVGLSYLRIENSQPSDKSIYMCRGKNSVNTVEETVELKVIDVCQNNSVQAPGGDEPSLMQDWSFVGDSASVVIVNNETVFKLDYIFNSPQEITQTVSLPPNTVQLQISARMRSVRDPSSSSPNNSPEILVESHNSNGTISSIVSLLLPNSLLDSWQWVGGVFNTPPVDNVTLRLAVRPDQSQNGNSDGTGNGNAYFDDLCVSSTLTSNDTVTPTPGDDDLIYLVSGAAGGGALLLLCTLLLCISCCYLCCCRKKKKSGVVKMMSKMSFKLNSLRRNTSQFNHSSNMDSTLTPCMNNAQQNQDRTAMESSEQLYAEASDYEPMHPPRATTGTAGELEEMYAYPSAKNHNFRITSPDNEYVVPHTMMGDPDGENVYSYASTSNLAAAAAGGGGGGPPISDGEYVAAIPASLPQQRTSAGSLLSSSSIGAGGGNSNNSSRSKLLPLTLSASSGIPRPLLDQGGSGVGMDLDRATSNADTATTTATTAEYLLVLPSETPTAHGLDSHDVYSQVS